MKRAIRYLRFSNIGQSNGSIERQELYTDQWIKSNDIELVDTFIDRGKVQDFRQARFPQTARIYSQVPQSGRLSFG
jgi:hypothetical protein